MEMTSANTTKIFGDHGVTRQDTVEQVLARYDVANLPEDPVPYDGSLKNWIRFLQGFVLDRPEINGFPNGWYHSQYFGTRDHSFVTII
jgi:hypothetical protein